MIIKNATGYIKSPYNMGDCRILEDFLSVYNAESDEYHPYGYIVHDNALYIPNIDIGRYLEPLNEKTVTNVPPTKWKQMSRHHMSNVPPRDTLQENVISFLTGTGMFKENKKEHQLAVIVPPGKGKAQPLSTIIPSPIGNITMGELKVGDYVFDRHGNPTMVTGVFDRGVLPIYSVILEDGRKTKCCGEHLWDVVDGDKHSVMSLDEIISCGDVKSIPTNGIVQFNHRDVSDDPFVVGVNAAKNINDNIPNEYIFNSVDVRRKLLDGIFSVCGHMEDTNEVIDCISHTLATKVAYIIRSLGITPMITKNTVIFNRLEHGTSVKIIEIIPCGEEHCRCIMVDNDEHLYLTEDFIVTHNTFTTVYSVTELNRKCLIITHMVKIKKQWIDTFTGLFDYKQDEMMELSTSALDMVLNGTDFDKDVYFISHQVLNLWISNQSPTALSRVLETLGIGIKVIDEYHLQWRNSLVLDMFSNIDKNFYLTATFGRSDQGEDILFKRITKNFQMYGSDERPEEDKHTVYHPVFYTTKCPFKVVRGIGNGRGMGIRKWKYADWQHFDDPSNTCNGLIMKIVDMCLIEEGKVLVTVASIAASEHVCDIIKKQYPDILVGCINSSHSVKDNEYVKERAKIIVSTVSSIGTGADIKGLRYVINAEPFASKVTAEQFLGRLRPYFNDAGEQLTTYLFDFVDKSIIYSNIYYKGRSKRINQLVKDIIPLE